MTTPAETVSRSTLEQLPQRVLTFLNGLGNSLTLRAILAKHGYGPEDHEEGWHLLQACSGHKAHSSAASEQMDTNTREAIIALDNWDEGGFAIAKATLLRRFRTQHDFVFDQLAASTGPAAVLGVKTFLDRLDALESSPERKATRKLDREALDLLAKRGIDSAKRAELRALVDRAQKVADVEPVSVSVAQSQAELDETSKKALLSLYGWYKEWTTIAKAAISRRDHLIRLGLATRKQAKKAVQA